MARAYRALIAGGALAIVPLAMGSIPLLKLLLFALAALVGAAGLCGTRPHSFARQIRTVSVYALREGRMVWGFLCAFFAVVFLSPLWSIAPLLSVAGVEPRFEGVLTYGVFLGLAIGAWGMVRSGREWSLLRAIAWSNVGVVAYGLLQLLGMDLFSGFWDAEAFLGRVFSTVGQPNMLGQFLVLTAPLAALAAWQWKGTSAAVGVLVANLIVLLATGSRAAMLGTIVATGIFLLLGFLSRRERGFCLSPCIVFFVLVFAFLPLACQRFSLPGEWDRSLRSRTAIWRDAASMIRARPMGWGLETMGIIFPRFQRAPLTSYESLTTSVDRAHSKPLDLLLTVGPLGLISYYAFLLLLLLRCFRTWKSRRDPLMLAGMAGLAGMSVSLLFGFEGVVVHAFFWLVCGMLLGSMRNPHPNPLPWEGRGDFPPPFKGDGKGEGLRKCPLWAHGVVMMPMILLLVAIALTTLSLSLSSRFTAGRAERAFGSDNLALAVQLYDRVARMVPWDRALLIRFIETALVARERAADSATQEKVDAVLTKRLRRLDRLTSGSDPLLPSLRAWHAALRGEREEAIAFLIDAKSRAPFSIPRLRIAWKVAELLRDTSMRGAIRAELTRMLPPWWNDARDSRSRILWKENSWLEELFTPPSHYRSEKGDWGEGVG